MYSALADRGACSPPADSALSLTYGAAWRQPPRPASGSSSSAQYDHLAAEPRGAVYTVPGALAAAGPQGQADLSDITCEVPRQLSAISMSTAGSPEAKPINRRLSVV